MHLAVWKDIKDFLFSHTGEILLERAVADFSKKQERVTSECFLFWVLTINMPTAAERRELSYTAPEV